MNNNPEHGVRYQLTVETELGPDSYGIRPTWEDAAKDAELAGVGRWLNKNEFQLDRGATIKAIHTGHKHGS